MQNLLTVGLGELKISRDPHDVLVCYGLGSCVGIGMYDPSLRLAGLLHALLPTPPNGSRHPSAKYVDTGIHALIEELLNAGAEKGRLIVRMAGGANMLVDPGFSPALNIGSRNVEMAWSTLQGLHLPVASQEVGGNIGRTVRFYVTNGQMTIRTVGNQEREI